MQEASPSPLPSSSPAVAVAVPPAPPLKPPAPEPQVILQPGVVLQPEVVLKPQVVVQPQVVLEPEVVSQPEVVLQPEVVSQTEVVLQPEVVEKPEPRSIPEAAPPAAHDAALAGPGTFADRLADLAEQLHGERVPYAAQRIVPSAASSRPRVEQAEEKAPVILDVTPARPLLAQPPSVLLLAEPQPPSVAAHIPAREIFRPLPSAHPAQSRPPLGVEPSAPLPIRLPDRPGRAAAPALAPLQDYHKAAERQMRPAAYASQAAAAPTVGETELRVTLPGPALPRELMSLQAAGLVPIRGTGRYGAQSNGSAWITRFAVLGILLTVGLAATYRIFPGPSANEPVKPAPESAPEHPAVAAKPDNSLARFVEVTGVRFLEVNKKPQIRYLVVNHSSAPLGSVMVYVTLRAIDAKPGQPPLARLTFRSPDLAAFEAKEMASPIERVVGPLDLPDWRNLHADVEVQ